MKTNNYLRLLTVLSLSMAINAFGAAGSISTSKHNLSTSGTGDVKAKAGGVNEICVFCHTPHGSNTTFTAAPLWNKVSPSGVTYVMYGATIATTTQDAEPASPSKACLSCHDGVSAINSIVNAPGSGIAGAASAMDTGFALMTTGTDGTALKMDDSKITSIGGYGTSGASTADLSNDHPISIVYGGAKANSEDGTTGTPGSLKTRSTDVSTWTTPGGIGTIQSLLRDNKVECSTCHDPHLGDNGTEQVLFLRSGNNVGSKLCLGCHNK